MASIYMLIEGELYKKSFTLSYLKCLGKEESELAMRKIHEGIYENHTRGRTLAHKALPKDFIGQR